MSILGVKELLTPATVTVIGLVLDMIGVLVLYRYGLPPRTESPPKELKEQGFSADLASRTIHRAERGAASALPDKVEAWYSGLKRRYKRGARVAIALLCIGFGLQAIAALME